MLESLLTRYVSKGFDLKEMADRLRAAAAKKGIQSAKQLESAMAAAGSPIKYAFARSIWHGENPAVVTNVAPVLEFLELSFDQYVFGRPPKKLSVSELKQIVGEMIESEGAAIPERDPATLEIQRLLSKVETADQKAAIIRMMKAFIEES